MRGIHSAKIIVGVAVVGSTETAKGLKLTMRSTVTSNKNRDLWGSLRSRFEKEMLVACRSIPIVSEGKSQCLEYFKSFIEQNSRTHFVELDTLADSIDQVMEEYHFGFDVAFNRVLDNFSEEGEFAEEMEQARLLSLGMKQEDINELDSADRLNNLLLLLEARSHIGLPVYKALNFKPVEVVFQNMQKSGEPPEFLDFRGQFRTNHEAAEHLIPFRTAFATCIKVYKECFGQKNSEWFDYKEPEHRAKQEYVDLERDVPEVNMLDDLFKYLNADGGKWSELTFSSFLNSFADEEQTSYNKFWRALKTDDSFDPFPVYSASQGSPKGSSGSVGVMSTVLRRVLGLGSKGNSAIAVAPLPAADEANVGASTRLLHPGSERSDAFEGASVPSPRARRSLSLPGSRARTSSNGPNKKNTLLGETKAPFVTRPSYSLRGPRARIDGLSGSSSGHATQPEPQKRSWFHSARAPINPSASSKERDEEMVSAEPSTGVENDGVLTHPPTSESAVRVHSVQADDIHSLQRVPLLTGSRSDDVIEAGEDKQVHTLRYVPPQVVINSQPKSTSSGGPPSKALLRARAAKLGGSDSMISANLPESLRTAEAVEDLKQVISLVKEANSSGTSRPDELDAFVMRWIDSLSRLDPVQQNALAKLIGIETEILNGAVSKLVQRGPAQVGGADSFTMGSGGILHAPFSKTSPGVGLVSVH
jgi:hypothetical protein